MRTDWLKRFSFRLALGQALGYLLLSGATFAALYVGFSAAIDAQLRRDIRRDTSDLLARYGAADAELLEVVENRTHDRAYKSWYALRAADGRWLAGDLGAAPTAPGWSLRAAPAALAFNERSEHEFLALTTELPDGRRLVVARDTHTLAELREFARNTALLLLVLNLLVASAFGAGAGRALRRRFRAIGDTADRVAAGDLHSRVAISSRNDEFDRLGTQINHMLERIAALMARLRQVSLDVAHDLRTPLTRLRHRLDPDAMPRSSDAAVQPLLEAARADLDAVLATFDALLRIARIEDGSPRDHFTRVDFSSALAGLVEIYAPVAEESGHLLLHSIERDVCVDGDRALLVQAVANLVENALRHTPAGTHIDVRLQRTTRGVDVCVVDDGPGIPEPDRARVLQPFVRLRRDRGGDGNGLGLSLVQAIAELHGGALTLEDATPQGLCVRLRLAASQTAGGA